MTTLGPKFTWGRDYSRNHGLHDDGPIFPPYVFAAGGSGPSSHPFKVTAVNASDEVIVKFGQINNVTPNNVDTEITVITGVVYLDCTVDVDGLVTAATIGNALTVPAGTNTHAYRILAYVVVTAGVVVAVNQSVTHSLGFQRCGEGIYNFWGL